MALCFRCENRATFLEGGPGPRAECKGTSTDLHTCYAYRPTRPCTLSVAESEKRHGIKRPPGGPSAIAARMSFVGVTECVDVMPEDGDVFYPTALPTVLIAGVATQQQVNSINMENKPKGEPS
jgi:hypothetical protein